MMLTRTYTLGKFDTLEEAKKAYDDMTKILFGEFHYAG